MYTILITQPIYIYFPISVKAYMILNIIIAENLIFRLHFDALF